MVNATTTLYQKMTVARRKSKKNDERTSQQGLKVDLKMTMKTTMFNNQLVGWQVLVMIMTRKQTPEIVEEYTHLGQTTIANPAHD